jgi:hypothetical protein
MRRFLRENSLTLVMFGLFLVFLIGQIVAGYHDEKQELEDHGRPAIALTEYLTSGAFVEAVFENWESEFLQMAAFVFFSVFLRQRGSPESKKLEGKEEVDQDPEQQAPPPDAPWPVHRGGLVLTLYKHSLSLALALLFLASFGLHALGGEHAYNEEQLLHHGQTITLLQYLSGARFWFESFQNWQSEFLSVGALVFLSIFLREKGSPESKPVAAPHAETGE